MSRYEFAILGAGAIGSILGGHLARAGHSVVMLAREGRARQLDTEGIRIKGLVEFATPVATLRDTSRLAEAEVLIVAMKTQGTAEALEKLRHAAIEAAFSIQNGLLKNELLEHTFGAGRVLGALADTSGEMLPSGEVVFTRNVNILLGELSGEASARAHGIAARLNASGVRAAVMADILRLEWSKFAAWAGLMALSVTTRASTWKYLVDPDSALLLARLVREIGALARAAGIELTDQSVLPVASMCRGTEHEAVNAVLTVGRKFESSVAQHRMSALQDLEAGRSLETEATLGYALRKARQLGLDLPLLDAFQHLVSAVDRTNRS